jgi:hypothetical protein
MKHVLIQNNVNQIVVQINLGKMFAQQENIALYFKELW